MRIHIIALGLVFVITSCTRPSAVQVEPADVVLEKTRVAMQSLTGVSYDLQAQALLQTDRMNIHIAIQGGGVSQADPALTSFGGEIALNGTLSEEFIDASSTVELVQEGLVGTYYKFTKLQVEPSSLRTAFDDWITVSDDWQFSAEETGDNQSFALYPEQLTELAIEPGLVEFNQSVPEYVYTITLDSNTAESFMNSSALFTWLQLTESELKALLEAHDFIATIHVRSDEYFIEELEWQLVPVLNPDQSILTVRVALDSSFTALNLPEMSNE